MFTHTQLINYVWYNAVNTLKVNNLNHFIYTSNITTNAQQSKKTVNAECITSSGGTW